MPFSIAAESSLRDSRRSNRTLLDDMMISMHFRHHYHIDTSRAGVVSRRQFIDNDAVAWASISRFLVIIASHLPLNSPEPDSVDIMKLE
jgi:hypothetical protein